MNTHADVATPLRYAAVWAGEVMALGTSIVLAVEIWRGFWLLSAGIVVGGVMYWLVTRPMLHTGGLDVDGWLKTRSRDAEPLPQEQAATGAYTVEGRLQTSDKQTLYLKFELDDYESALAWHQFCKAVLRGKNFSGREAKKHGLSPTDWRRIYEAFVAQHRCTAVGTRGTPELINDGRAHVRQFARTPPGID